MILLKDKEISSILNDNEGGYWFSTLYDGIYYLPNINVKSYSKVDGLVENDVRSLTFDSTSLWMGYNNFYVQNLTNETVYNPIKINELNIFNYNIFYDSINTKLWIGSQTLTTIKNSKIEDYYHNHGNGIAKNIHCKDFYLEPDGLIWFATYSGLHNITNQKKKTKFIKLVTLNKKLTH